MEVVFGHVHKEGWSLDGLMCQKPRGGGQELCSALGFSLVIREGSDLVFTFSSHLLPTSKAAKCLHSPKRPDKQDERSRREKGADNSLEVPFNPGARPPGLSDPSEER